MTQKWREIWNRRAAPEGAELDLAALIRLDGCDTGAGRVAADSWRINVARIAEKLGFRPGDSVFDVGCGSGAFLVAARELRAGAVGGIDYGAGLVAAARRVLPDGDFTVGDAVEMAEVPAYDHVVSHGVFHYFGLESAAVILDRMLRKARKTVAVLEVPDLATREAAETERRNALSPEEYERKYAGLGHTYYPREWFREQAARHGRACEFFPSCMPDYAQSIYRFNCLMRPG